MPRHIVVDGYNLLFAIGKSPHQADRDYLLDVLAAYKGRKSVDITVVFDRKTGNAGEGRQLFLHRGVRVVFTAPAQEADEIIRRIVEDSKNTKDLLIVSSDKAGVSKYCRKLGAAVAESRDFFDFLIKTPAWPMGCSEDTEQKPDVRKEDIDYYLKKFEKKK